MSTGLVVEFLVPQLLSMEEMIRQIRAASVAGLYYLALFGALTLPDICGALAASDGKASKTKYTKAVRCRMVALSRSHACFLRPEQASFTAFRRR